MLFRILVSFMLTVQFCLLCGMQSTVLGTMDPKSSELLFETMHGPRAEGLFLKTNSEAELHCHGVSGNDELFINGQFVTVPEVVEDLKRKNLLQVGDTLMIKCCHPGLKPKGRIQGVLVWYPSRTKEPLIDTQTLLWVQTMKESDGDNYLWAREQICIWFTITIFTLALYCLIQAVKKFFFPIEEE